MVLHEWDIEEAGRPKLITDGSGREEYEGTEKLENIVTWIYDGTSFTPVAKVADGERYTIVHNYLGTPTQAYDSRGNLVWEMLLGVYGEVKECHGDRTLVPFRYQGQYEDIETGLYYNRFRYYSPDMGMYISSDPIGLNGNNPTLYGYVEDSNIWLDYFGLYKPVIFPQNQVLVQVTIKMQGSRNLDYKAANEVANIIGKRGKPTIKAHQTNYGDVTWHHAKYNPETNECIMQLVKTPDHIARLPHEGGVKYFEQNYDVKYDTIEAVKLAKTINCK